MKIKSFRGIDTFSYSDFYIYETRNKLIVFVPLTHVEKVALALSKAGAGKIGNYEQCSFRTEGIGTFKPGTKARPYSGKRNKLSFEKEIKLEMEFAPDRRNEIVDELLRIHPYEEVAYEIYEFQKRCVKSAGKVITLRKSYPLLFLMRRLKLNTQGSSSLIQGNVKKIALIHGKINDETIKAAKAASCRILIRDSDKKLQHTIL